MSTQKARLVERARRFLNMHGHDLKKKYAIEGCAIGYKVKDGRYTDTISLVLYVKKKKSKKELLSEGILQIPEVLAGIPTDVVARPKGIQPR